MNVSVCEEGSETCLSVKGIVILSLGELEFLSFLDICPGVGLLGHVIALF